jgi:hypothetical protein
MDEPAGEDGGDGVTQLVGLGAAFRSDRAAKALSTRPR